MVSRQYWRIRAHAFPPRQRATLRSAPSDALDEFSEANLEVEVQRLNTYLFNSLVEVVHSQRCRPGTGELESVDRATGPSAEYLPHR